MTSRKIQHNPILHQEPRRVPLERETGTLYTGRSGLSRCDITNCIQSSLYISSQPLPVYYTRAHHITVRHIIANWFYFCSYSYRNSPTSARQSTGRSIINSARSGVEGIEELELKKMELLNKLSQLDGLLQVKAKKEEAKVRGHHLSIFSHTISYLPPQKM
jgi:hypothetical protein